MNIDEKNTHSSSNLISVQQGNDDLGFDINVFLIAPDQFDVAISGLNFEHFINAVNSSGTGIWGFDLESSSLFICKYCQELLHLTDLSVVKVDFFTGFLPAPYKDQVIGFILSSIRKRESFDREFPIIILKDSPCKWIKLTASIGTLDQWPQLKVFGTLSDVTERKRTEDLRKDLLFMVAHDLRSPLSAIKLLVQLVKRIGLNLRNKTVVGYTDKAEFLIEKLNRMIQCLLEVSEIEFGKLNIFSVSFNMTDLLIEAVDDIRLLNASHRFILRTEPCMQVFADKDKISQVVQNMLSNAIKYSPGADKVIIECKKINKCLKVSFTDFGIGINAMNQKKVFDRFYRVESKQTKVIEGYGIGLYLCKQIILAHGGDIGVQSQHNQGSTFYFSVPSAHNNDET